MAITNGVCDVIYDSSFGCDEPYDEWFGGGGSFYVSFYIHLSGLYLLPMVYFHFLMQLV